MIPSRSAKMIASWTGERDREGEQKTSFIFIGSHYEAGMFSSLYALSWAEVDALPS